MRKYDLLSSLAWLTVGVIFFQRSVGLGLGELGEPGPGFFPFLVSVCLICFSSIYFVSSLRKRGQLSSVESSRFWPKSDGLIRISLVVMSLFMFIFTMNYLGFVVTTFLFMFLLLRFIEPKKWLAVLLVACLTTFLSYAIFQLWLKADLPRGGFGF